MECVRRCEFQEFDGEHFNCNLYEQPLNSEINQENGTLLVNRCRKCIIDGMIGTNSKEEFTRKLKQHIGWMMDSFYSFKDDLEEEVTHLYRIIKELEDNESISFSEATGDNERESNETSTEV